MNDLYMACINLHSRPCLVVGGGSVGFEKAEGLLASGAAVTVVAPEVGDGIRDLLAGGRLVWHRREYDATDLDGMFLVVAATSIRAVNERVHRDAEARALLVNVADVPDLCNFILPAVARRGEIALAVSTNGASPALAKRIRREMEELLGHPYARLAEILASLRPWAKENLATYQQRKVFFEQLVDGEPDPVKLVRDGREAELWAIIEDNKQIHRRAASAHEGQVP